MNWFELLKDKKILAFDTETVSLDDYRLVAFSLSDGTEQGTVAVLLDNLSDKEKKKQYDELYKLLSNLDVIFTWNAKFDIKVLWYNFGSDKFKLSDWGHKFYDGMLLKYLLNENATSYELKYTIKEEFNKEVIEYKQFKNHIEDKTIFEHYCKQDALYTYLLTDKYLQEVKKDQPLFKYANKILFPSSFVLAGMEYEGFLIDVQSAVNLGSQLYKEYLELLKDIRKEFGKDFNPSSSKQVGELLLKLNLNKDIIERTEKGNIKTDTEVLERILEKTDNQVLKKILDIRNKRHYISTYIDGMIERLDDNNRIHSDYKLHGTVTGRLSSSPNLQNLNSDSKKFFIAPEGKSIVCADLNQIELRLMAHLSKDKTMIEQYCKGDDLHSKTAEVFNVERKMAKIINFGLIYGGGVTNLAKSLGVPLNEAKEFRTKFFDTYKGILSYYYSMESILKKYGYVRNMFGKKRRPVDSDFERCKRQAINFGIQSSVADLVLYYQLELQYRIEHKQLSDPLWNEVKLINQVHDEIIYEVPNALIKEFAKMIFKITSLIPLSVPVLFEVGVGKSWKEAKENAKSEKEFFKNYGDVN